MLRTGLILDPRYQEHRAGRSHPERPERIATLLEWEQKDAPEKLIRLAPRRATTEEIALNHDPLYIGTVATTAGKDSHAFDADTRTSPHSYETALLAAGGVLEMLDGIMAGRIDNGFAAVRPPGHHAEHANAMGFCLFNNVAIGARYLQKIHGLERILIVDWDVHHGNGTEQSFYRDKNVMYISLHQYPHYPGTGAAEDTGFAEGEGYNINIPLPAGCGDAQYRMAFRTIVEPIARQFNPQFVIISAGMDCHYLDPLGDMQITEEGISEMTQSLMKIANDHAKGRCAAVLEGGYDLNGLQKSSARVVENLMKGPIDVIDADVKAESPAILGVVKAIQKKYWNL